MRTEVSRELPLRCGFISQQCSCILVGVCLHKGEGTWFVCTQVVIYLSKDKLCNVFMHKCSTSRWDCDTEQMCGALSSAIHPSGYYLEEWKCTEVCEIERAWEFEFSKPLYFLRAFSKSKRNEPEMSPDIRSFSTPKHHLLLNSSTFVVVLYKL